MNQGGDGIMNAAVIPPARNKAPTVYANADRRVAAPRWAIRAPTKLPAACARKGKRKCLGVSRWAPAARPSAVVISTPSGGGIRRGPTTTSAMLTTLPSTNPRMRARRFLSRIFMVVGETGRRFSAARDGLSDWRLRRFQGEVVVITPFILPFSKKEEALRGKDSPIALASEGDRRPSGQ